MHQVLKEGVWDLFDEIHSHYQERPEGSTKKAALIECIKGHHKSLFGSKVQTESIAGS